jgi:hypothetical protein
MNGEALHSSFILLPSSFILHPWFSSSVDSAPMRRSTSVKLAIAAVIALFFAGFILRAAARLASAAMHSFFILALLVIVAIWVATRMLRDSE